MFASGRSKLQQSPFPFELMTTIQAVVKTSTPLPLKVPISGTFTSNSISFHFKMNHSPSTQQGSKLEVIGGFNAIYNYDIFDQKIFNFPIGPWQITTSQLKLSS